MAFSPTDNNQEIELYDSTLGIAFPSFGTDGGGDLVCSLYQIPIYPTYILIAPDSSIVEQNIYPVDGPSLISLIEGYGPGMSACPNSESEITQFYLPAQSSPAIIGMNDIYLPVPNGTDLSSLAPSFILSYGASAEVNGVIQQSGVSEVDFSLGPVIYTVTAQDNLNSTDWLVTVDNGLLIEEIDNSLAKVYPNPAKNKLFISEGNWTEISVFSSTGALVISTGRNHKCIDLSQVADGIYFIQLKNSSTISSSRFVIQR